MEKFNIIIKQISFDVFLADYVSFLVANILVLKSVEVYLTFVVVIAVYDASIFLLYPQKY